MSEKSLELSNLNIVRYNNPILITKPESIKKGEKEVRRAFRSFLKTFDFFVIFQETPKFPKDSERPCSEAADARTEIEEILNRILPPRCWEGLKKKQKLFFSIYTKKFF